MMTGPLPRRIAWFAPWTWKRRWKIVAACLVLALAFVASDGIGIARAVLKAFKADADGTYIKSR